MALDTKQPKGYRKAWNGGKPPQAPRAYTQPELERDFAPNWQRACCNCAAKPVVPLSGLCGPCHWGTAAAVDGGWWDEAAKTIHDFVFGGR